MDAQQCVKLTGTNRSIGLLPPALPRPTDFRQTDSAPDKLGARQTGIPHHNTRRTQKADNTTPPVGLADLVALARGPTPDPIPNSAVKTLSADGTASQGVGE